MKTPILRVSDPEGQGGCAGADDDKDDWVGVLRKVDTNMCSLLQECVHCHRSVFTVRICVHHQRSCVFTLRGLYSIRGVCSLVQECVPYL